MVLFVAAWIATAEGGPDEDEGPLPGGAGGARSSSRRRSLRRGTWAWRRCWAPAPPAWPGLLSRRKPAESASGPAGGHPGGRGAAPAIAGRSGSGAAPAARGRGHRRPATDRIPAKTAASGAEPAAAGRPGDDQHPDPGHPTAPSSRSVEDGVTDPAGAVAGDRRCRRRPDGPGRRCSASGAAGPRWPRRGSHQLADRRRAGRQGESPVQQRRALHPLPSWLLVPFIMVTTSRRPFCSAIPT